MATVSSSTSSGEGKVEYSKNEEDNTLNDASQNLFEEENTKKRGLAKKNRS